MRPSSIHIRASAWVAAILLLACSRPAGHEPAAPTGASDDPEPKASVEKSAPAEASEGPAPFEVPEACADPDANVCAPSAEFTERLCSRVRPGLPFLLFKKGTPWTRGYIRVNTEAWYAGGGPAHPEKMQIGEEVLIVAVRDSSPSGIKVSGSGSYDVYRWNGSCVSLMADEVTRHRIGMAKVAPIDWKRLAEETRAALLKDKGVAFRYEMYEKHCKRGKWESKACKHHQGALDQIAAAYVRDGAEVPVPLSEE